MNRFKKYFIPLITGVITISLSSCAVPSTTPNSDSASSSTTLTNNTPLINQLDSSTSTPNQRHKESVATPPSNPTQSKPTSLTHSSSITINIYQADNQCRSLIPAKATVPAGSPVTTAVGRVLKQVDSADFELAGYRVNVNTKSGIATVDLRRTPNSQRQFVSLSICEQFALFGSLRKTLVANSQLKIKDVRFTEQGQEIKL